MSKFIDPERAQYSRIFRRGGGMDKAGIEYVCEQCHKPFKFTARQIYRLERPVCPGCGAEVKRLPEQGKRDG